MNTSSVLPATKPLILIVDDSADNLRLAADCISQNIECDFSFATSGEQALLSAVDCHPNLILLDIMMPGMDGIEICRQLKANPETQAIPILFVTARDHPEDLVRGFAAGGVDYITKPFHSVELSCRVTTHLQLGTALDVISKRNQELNQLLQILCHDLANPISAIQSVLLLASEEPSILPDLIDDLKEASGHAQDVIELTRQMHALQPKERQFTEQEILLFDFVYRSYRTFESRLRKKSIRCHIDVPKGLSVRVEPVSFFNSVLANLMTNAIKFSHPSGTIFLRAEALENGFVRLDVEDHGVGVKPDVLENLFSGSHLNSQPGTNGESGTGFGLPLVKKFVESYGGTISIQSAQLNSAESPSKNFRTTISLFLPATKQVAERAAENSDAAD